MNQRTSVPACQRHITNIAFFLYFALVVNRKKEIAKPFNEKVQKGQHAGTLVRWFAGSFALFQHH